MIPTAALRPIRNLLAPYAHLLQAQKVLRGFRPKARISLQRGNFRVKTAETVEEVEQVLKLRHDIFHAELLQRKLPFGLEFDSYDSAADHLIVIDERVDRIVGTYRLTCSKFTHRFYSQSEFMLDPLLALPGGKLELSRACIHQDYRDGMAIHLLWRGLITYLQHVESTYLFGCASVKTMDRGEIAFIHRYLRQKGHLEAGVLTQPLPDFEIANLSAEEERWGRMAPLSNLDSAKALLPPLFLAYLRAGAKVYGAPALDRDFKCADFLMVLRIDQLSGAFERKYSS